MRNDGHGASRGRGRDQPTAKPLEGRWRLERLSGVLPPLSGACKEIRGNRGKTRFDPLPGIPFRVDEREAVLALVYRRPFSMLVDEVREGPDGAWFGKATLSGCAIGRFRMTRVSQHPEKTQPEGGREDESSNVAR